MKQTQLEINPTEPTIDYTVSMTLKESSSMKGHMLEMMKQILQIDHISILQYPLE